MKRLLVSLFAVSALLAPRVASACSQACIPQPHAADGKTLPIGTTGIPLPHSLSEGQGISLTASDGTVIATSLRRDPDTAIPELTFDGPLAAGHYDLAYHAGCVESSNGLSFDIGGAAPSATAVGSLVLNSQHFVPDNGAHSDCGGFDGDRIDVSMTFHPDPSSAPYLPVTELVVMDGEQIVGSYAGVKGDTVITRSIACTQSGKHTFTVRSHTLGPLGDSTAATTTVDIQCDDDSAAIAPDSPTKSTAGCSTIPARAPAGTSVAAVALGLAVIGAIRRRR